MLFSFGSFWARATALQVLPGDGVMRNVRREEMATYARHLHAQLLWLFIIIDAPWKRSDAI